MKKFAVQAKLLIDEFAAFVKDLCPEEHMDVNSKAGLLMNNLANLEATYYPKEQENTNLINTSDVKFLHAVTACMSFGLYIDDTGTGWLAVSSAARDGTLDAPEALESRHTDIYSKAYSRKVITERFNHFFDNLPKRKYTNSQVLSIGKVQDRQELYKMIRSAIFGQEEEGTRITDGLLCTANFIERKDFVLSSLSMINAILEGQLNEDSLYEVINFVHNYMQENYSREATRNLDSVCA